MSIKYSSAAAAVALLFAGCGGGAESSDTPQQAAAGAMRAHALAVSAAAVSPVTAEEAARQAMDYAETHYRALFPEAQATLSSGPFKYRAYSNGVLLGVVVSADPNYTLNGVYVMGGTFGNAPVFVGLLTSYLTPVVPGPGPVGTNNGCFNLNLLTASGTQFDIGYEHTGPVTGQNSVQTAVNGFAAFEGQQQVETLVKTTGTLFDNGLPYSAASEVRYYSRKTGDAEMTRYGSLSGRTVTVNDYIATTTETTVFSPPWLDRIAALGFEESLTSAYSGVTKRLTTYSSPNLPPNNSSFNVNVNESIRYVGRETLTVIAGTYPSCKFVRVDATTGSVTSEWVLAGVGVLLKSVKVTGAVTQSMEARIVMQNGNPL